jgi:5-formyltetrahydrofolate cyclo-ligase
MEAAVEKVAMRRRMRALLAGMDAETCRQHSEVIAKRAMSLPSFVSARCVCLYVSTGGEAGTHELIAGALAQGRRVCVPWLDRKGGTYRLSEISAFPSDLAPGAFGILEPVADKIRLVEAPVVDLWFVPGLAFDARGMRLGRGRGVYDRLLKNAGGVRVGLAYDAQIVDRLPVESHDVRMDWLVTEAGATLACM